MTRPRAFSRIALALLAIGVWLTPVGFLGV
jgi:hypothetical protein